jgi:hypothetical protein
MGVEGGIVGRAYERILELSLVVVLVAMWLVGGCCWKSCTLALYGARVVLR